MTAFHVEPEAVHGLSGQVSRQGEYAQHYRHMLEDPGLTASEVDEGLLAIILPALDGFQADAKHNTELAGTLGSAAGYELRRAAVDYANTDSDSAARLDRTFPEERSEPVDQDDVTDPQAAGTFRDTSDPLDDPSGRDFDAGKLANASDEELAKQLTADEHWPTGLEQLVEETVGLGGTLSAANDLIKNVTGVDLIQETIELLQGDWQQLHRQCVLFRQIGFAFGAIKQNIDQGRAGIAPRWDGNAASDAENWLARYSASCAAHTEYMTQAADRMSDFAQSSYHYIKYVRDAISVVIDIALEILSIFTGGTLKAVLKVIQALGKDVSNAGTIVDLAKSFGDGIDPQDLVKVASLIVTMNDHVARAQQGFSLLVGLAHGAAGYIEALAALQPVQSQPWPPEPYDHPGV